MSVSINSAYTNISSSNAAKLYVPVSKSVVLYSHFHQIKNRIHQTSEDSTVLTADISY